MNRGGEFLRARQQADLTNEGRAERKPLIARPCAWCALIASGIYDVVPRPSLVQCEAHTELNQEWTVRLRQLRIGDDEGRVKLRADILRRGIALTRPVTNSGAA